MPCKVCQKPTQREATGAGYKEYCSTKCMQTWRWANGKRDKTKSPFADPDVQKKAHETNIARYGAAYHMQNPEHAQEWKESYKEKTGYSSPLANPANRKIMPGSDKEAIIEYRKSHPDASDTAIAKVFPQYVRQTIRRILRDAGLPSAGQMTPDKEHDIIEYRKTHDVTNKELAEIFGVSPMTMGRVIKRSGMVPGANGTLTTVQTEAIIESKKSHTQESDSAIARRLGLRPGQVSTVLRAEGIESAWDISEKEKTDIIEYRKAHNFTDAEIAKTFNRSHDSVTKILRAEGIGPGSTSVPEMTMRRFIQHIFPNTEILYNTRKVIAPLEIDIYIPSLKLGIEVNGLYWHKERETYHYDKYKMAKEAGIDLIQVWDTELTLHHLRILKSMLTCRYLKTAKTIAARKCDLQEVNARVVEKFYRRNHWKGFLPSQHHLVLLDGDEVVAALSYSKARFSDGMEITRCCSKLNTVVMGGVQRLLKAVGTSREMISYSDNRLFSGRSFEQAGFDKQDRSPIGYFWFNSDRTILSRYMTQKHKLAQLLGDKFDATLSESDNMENAGYWKVYDAGQTIWKKPATQMFTPNLLKESV